MYEIIFFLQLLSWQSFAKETCEEKFAILLGIAEYSQFIKTLVIKKYK